MKRKSRVKLIVNPNADLGRAWQAAADLRNEVEYFGGADWAGTVYPSHASELAYQAACDGRYIKAPGPLGDFYRRLMKRKGAKIARVALARSFMLFSGV